MDAYFQKRVRVDDAGCWIWTKGIGRHGYGKACMLYQDWLAHRLSYHLHRGEIPRGLFVCHTCDVRRCVNPDHLFLGTCMDNLRDMQSKGRKVIQRGTEASNALLTDPQVLRAAHGPERLIDLAREFGVTLNCVWQIRVGITWGHLTGIRRARG